VPVLHHDPAIGRTAGDMGNVCDLTLEDIRRLDVGSWKGDKYRGERVPTLEEVLLEAREKTRIVAEVKIDCTEQIARIVNRLRLEQGLYFAAFRLDLIQKIYRVLPRFDVVWVLTAPEWLGFNSAKTIETASESEIRVVTPPVQALTDSSICCAHEVGLEVWTYACDTADELKRALEVGADGIVTAHPRELLTLMQAGMVSGQS
jgi:glycerophosphoryl diester phosphodiesterase